MPASQMCWHLCSAFYDDSPCEGLGVGQKLSADEPIRKDRSEGIEGMRYAFCTILLALQPLCKGLVTHTRVCSGIWSPLYEEGVSTPTPSNGLVGYIQWLQRCLCIDWVFTTIFLGYDVPDKQLLQ